MKYTELASQTVVEKTMAALKARNIHPLFVQNKIEALEVIKKLIPDSASVTTGSSTTLNQIGFIDLLKSGEHPWNNLKAAIANEPDEAKKTDLRRQSALADFMLGSVHALTEDGIALIASASGSQLPAYAYNSEHVIWVVGTHKIVPTLDDAFTRVRDHVFPLENERMQSTGASGTTFGKWLIFEREIGNRQIHLILVNEVLGF